MKTKRGLIIWATALGLVMAGVAPAAARKDNNPGEGPQPVEVEACEDAGADATDGTITITVPGGGSIQFECLWTPKDPRTPKDPPTDGNWAGKVGVEGELGSLVVFVRDDSPGDICLLEQLTQPEGTEFFEFALVDGSSQYWDDPTSWCKHFEPSDRVDLNGPPLHLSVGFRSKRGTTVTITLSVVQSDQTGT